MGNYIALGLIVVILAGAIIYLIRQKKKGVKCVGCPYSSKCNSCNCDHLQK